MKTRWFDKVTKTPLQEYPRPQLVRNNWLNLNGQWDFEIDDACVGVDKKYYLRSSLDGKITVPAVPAGTEIYGSPAFGDD